MARPGYREAIEWIALNDDIDIGSEDTGFIVSIAFVADLWQKEQSEVAAAVERYRKKNR